MQTDFSRKPLFDVNHIFDDSTQGQANLPKI
jgi:hypothetical protein